MTHPITPPPELVQQWAREIYDKTSCGYERDEHIATRAAQYGADQELEACCEWVGERLTAFAASLEAARRPKPPSLKEQALLAIDTAVADDRLSADVANVVRRALEVLPDD